MSLESRQETLGRLEQALGVPVLALVAGDRPGLTAGITTEYLHLLPKHLHELGEHESLALLIYARGGETHAAWPIVNLLREFCEELIVLIPFYAHSAGTLLALGADRILMSKFATLSPIDPTVANAFNPSDGADPRVKLPIAVEDVKAYLDLAQHGGVSNDRRLAAAFERLVANVHPLALGHVQRSIDQIRYLGARLLGLHTGVPPDRREELLHQLTAGLYSHYHLIGRREAAELGLHVAVPSSTVETHLMSYYRAIGDDLEILERSPFMAMYPAADACGPASNAATGIPSALERPVAADDCPDSALTYERAYIETPATADVYVTVASLGSPTGAGRSPSAFPRQLTVAWEGWRR